MFEYIDQEKMSSILNEELLLDIALYTVTLGEDNIHPMAPQIITLYIINNWAKEGKIEFTEDEVVAEYSKLLSSYVLEALSKKGLVDASISEGGVEYSITDRGKDIVDEYYNRKM